MSRCSWRDLAKTPLAITLVTMEAR